MIKAIRKAHPKCCRVQRRESTHLVEDIRVGLMKAVGFDRGSDTQCGSGRCWLFANVKFYFFATFLLIICLHPIAPPTTSLVFWELIHLALIFFSSSLHLDLVCWFSWLPVWTWPCSLFSWVSWLGKTQVSASGIRFSVYSDKTKGDKHKCLRCQADNKCVTWLAVT